MEQRKAAELEDFFESCLISQKNSLRRLHETVGVDSKETQLSYLMELVKRQPLHSYAQLQPPLKMDTHAEAIIQSTLDKMRTVEKGRRKQQTLSGFQIEWDEFKKLHP